MSEFSAVSVLRVGSARDALWQGNWGPANVVLTSGIYRCVGCDKEIVCVRRELFPPSGRHQHAGVVPMRWQLNVRTT